MDLLRRKRQSSAQSLQGLAIDSPVSSSPSGSSPASSIHELNTRNSGFFSSVKGSMKRSLSRASTSPPTGFADIPTTGISATPATPSRMGRVLHKHSVSSTNSMERRRSSATSEGRRRLSRAYSLTMTSSRLPSTGIDFKTAIDWKSQRVVAHCALEADPQVRSKPQPYLVVTSDYIVKMRSRTEALAAFPQIGPFGGKESGGLHMPTPEPTLVVPVHMIVSVFLAESSRPSFGIDLWWRSATCRAAYCSTQAFFSLPQDRSELISTIVKQLKAKNVEFPEASLVPLEVEAQIVNIFAKEEPEFRTCKPEIFPVVRRTSVREDVHSKDKARKSQDGSSWYLALGRNSCYLAEVGPGLPVEVKYQSFGLVTLDVFRANWTFHEERFVLSFREPFKPAVTLELSSRYYRQIVITFMKADRFLKPCWPTTLQTMEVFRVSGLTDPQLLIAGDNYGGLKRTLDAFLSAYHCSPVEWDINWKTALAPEFRLLPPKASGTYTNLQLLAVMRSLRYNGYFNAVSFKGVDLSGLLDKTDSAGRTPIPYVNKSCLALSEVELGNMRLGSLLHQEIHALAFCAETIRQIDFTNCFTEKNVRRNMSSEASGLGFLYPILNLLELGLTRCNRLVLSGNYFRSSDVDSLVDALMTQTVEIQALDISNCGLSDLALRDIFEVLVHQGHSLEALDASGNCGRVHVSAIANLSQRIIDLRKLNVSGILMGDIPGPIFSFETLSRFKDLEELDLSQCKINDATLNALESFLSQRPSPSEPRKLPYSGLPHDSSPSASTFSRLALNNCGINGREAARILRTLGNHPNIHLHLSGNPLEDGIDDFARAIALTPGPGGLHMDMVELRHEANYTGLMKALTLNKHINFLSMAGTTPTSSGDGPCGPEVCEALETFFRRNKSVRHLDMSGYSGKLDEGQLARGFARSLRGLADNDTLTHLRIRNQNLHDDVGTLGVVMRQNTTLRVVDCLDNSWNLTSIQFLVKSLKLNNTIVEFPFPPEEHERVWSCVVADLRRQSAISKAAAAMLQEQEGVLRAALQRQVQELREIVQRNRAALGADAAAFDQVKWTEIPTLGDSNTTTGNISRRLSRPPPLHSQSSRRTPQVQQATPSPQRLLDLDLDSDIMVTPVDPPLAHVTRKVHSVSSATTLRPHAVAAGDDGPEEQHPYHVGNDPDTLLLLETPPPPGGQSPSGGEAGASRNGGSSSPTEANYPVTPPSGSEAGTVRDEESDAGSVSPDLYMSGGGTKGPLGSPRQPTYASSFDMGPYFSNSGRDFVVSRFRAGGLEAHVEE